MTKPVTVVQYWAGCPKSPNSKWQSFLAIIRKCRAQGWRNYLVWSRMPENPLLVEPFREAGCKIILQTRSRRSFDLACVWRTNKLLRWLKCDIFHCYNDHTSPLIGAALASVPVRIWSKFAMSAHYEKGVLPKGLHRLVPSIRVSCLCAHQVLAISEKVRLELIELGGLDKIIDTVYVPVDYELFATATQGGIKRELGLNKSHILITAVGHAVPVKGWDIAIRAIARVHSLIPNVHLVLVGSGTPPKETKSFRQLTDLIKDCRLSKYVHFLGRRDDIPEILKTSDVFILPSRSEGMPAALIEAMAAGLPCVAARVGGIPEVIKHGENGLLFKRESVEELAGHLIKLIEDQSLRTKLAVQASSCARAFSMSAYVDKVVKCYKTLLGNNLARD